MDFFNVIMVFLGIVAIFAGAYEWAKKTVVCRNVRASTPEQIRKFSPIDGFTYIGEGILVILLAFENYLPFMKTRAAEYIVCALIVALAVYNYIMAKKLLNNFKE